jgi:hypothetical protein
MYCEMQAKIKHFMYKFHLLFLHYEFRDKVLQIEIKII